MWSQPSSPFVASTITGWEKFIFFIAWQVNAAKPGILKRLGFYVKLASQKANNISIIGFCRLLRRIKSDSCFSHSTRLLAATTLRNVLGTKNLSEILSERDTISNVMKTLLDEATDPWGVRVERVEVKDVRLPVQLQRAMAAEAEAAREARAKVILVFIIIVSGMARGFLVFLEMFLTAYLGERVFLICLLKSLRV